MSLQSRHNRRLASSGKLKARHDDDQEYNDALATLAANRAAGMHDPRVSLPGKASIQNIETGEVFMYRPHGICPSLNDDVLFFHGEQPRDPLTNKRLWLVVVASRQVGKSLTNVLCVENNCAYNEAHSGVILADTVDRAQTLFRYAMIRHRRRDPRYAPVMTSANERNQLTYGHDSYLRCLSAQSRNVGIGRTPDSFLGSEIPFHPNFQSMWSGIRPSLVHRANAAVVLESTPAPMSEPSAEVFKDLAAEARRGEGRWMYSFTSFFQSRLNEYPYQGETLTNDEIRLMQLFGPGGKHPSIGGQFAMEPPSNPGDTRYLTFENLMFRRKSIREDQALRRDPGMFWVWYPIDDITCWQRRGGGVIPSDVLQRHLDAHHLVPWPGGNYVEYTQPVPGEKVIIACDPAGYGDDHSAFQVIGCYRNKMIQRAVFGDSEISPTGFAEKIIQVAAKYNDATVIVERNGVGVAVCEILKTAQQAGRLRNLYYDGRGPKAKVGWAATKQSIDKSLGALIDELRDDGRLVLFDAETVDQLRGYRHDKLTAESQARQLIDPDGGAARGRRKKGHYDRASALALACLLAQEMNTHAMPRWMDAEKYTVSEEIAVRREAEGLTLADLKDLSYEVQKHKRAQIKNQQRVARLKKKRNARRPSRGDRRRR